MLAVTRYAARLRQYRDVLDALDRRETPVAVSGMGEIHKAHLASAVYRETGRPVLILCADEAECARLARDIGALTEERVASLTGREFTFYQAEVVSRQVEQARLHTLYDLASNRAPIVTATAAGLMQRCIPREVLEDSCDIIAMGQQRETGALTAALVRAGYRRSEQVEGPGQFALRGGILDFFSPAEEYPVRVEFWGDEIDSMGLFDPATQRRINAVNQAVILPTAEVLPSLHPEGEAGLIRDIEGLLARVNRRKTKNEALVEQLNMDAARLGESLGLPAADRYMAFIYDKFETPLDYLSPECTVLLSEPGRLEEAGKGALRQHREDIKMVLESGALDGSLAKFMRSWPELLEELTQFSPVLMENFMSRSHGPELQPRHLIHLTAKLLPSYGGSLDTAEADIGHYIGFGYRTVVLCGEERRAKILLERLRAAGLPAVLDLSPKDLPEPGTCVVSLGGLSSGMEYPEEKLAVITEGQLMRPAEKRPARKKRGKGALTSYADLSPGDLVVHEHHGIGRFVGIVPMDIDGGKKDYIKIAYQGSDSLYVPATQLDLVSKYIGGGEDRPVKLNKMGGADWNRVRTKAKGAAKDLAKGLIQLYAERRRQTGYAFSPDSNWQREFEDAFEYTETDDQRSCTNEIKRDMESAIPMDRLLCGDVGYGKTEVALRAVMKCVLDNKQAAILVPTTVLAQQHYVTAARRFDGYPVKIEVLSRFKTPTQTKKIAAAIERGEVDIVIGTHKILQKDIRFKDLGLLIVDEEQRFGVTHKERLKEMSKDVDVLTLSATPIPRTLNMALSGIRDMSTIEEPPQNRRPVQTYVMEHDWGVVADAIRRELGRGGQVYYLHNRVESIESTAAKLREITGGAKIAVAHGQMDEQMLGRVMENMISGESQILICTTIIETGIDIPNVNTLIIEDADKMGLAQLHQIRGRVGRSSRSAFAYLTYRPGKVLSEIAAKRLGAIREFAEFNSGFKIALRDLEIRGAGNLLGAEQSGHMMSVGYDMYLKLLNEAVLEEKGEAPPVRADCAADLAVDANIPQDYVSAAEQRMDLYQRIAQIRTDEDAEDILDELIDRYGEPPKSVESLIRVALLRGMATGVGITEVAQRAGWLSFTFSIFEMERISAVYGQPAFKGRIKIQAGDVPVIRMKLKSGDQVIDEAMAFVQAYAESVNKQ